MKHVKWVAAVVLGISSLVHAEDPQTTQLDKPLSVQLLVQGEQAPEKVWGRLTRYNDETLWVKTTKAERELKWADLTPANAYATRVQLIDRKKAGDWLKLAEFAVSVGAKEQARTAIATAVKMDASLKSQANQLLASLKNPPKPEDKKADAKAAKGEKDKFAQATPEQHQKAIAEARDAAKEVATTLNLKFQELQTDHFLIFTDWDPREQNFLKENLELAYAAVARQFNVSPKDNIFVGKLPVYMLAKQDDFSRFASDVDKFPVSDEVAGYYHGSNGQGHMAMWKPAIGKRYQTIQSAKRSWASTLVHEFTHAFVARYHGNRHILTWFNEGIAITVELQQFPEPYELLAAKRAAMTRTSLKDIFEGDKPKKGEAYPVMWSLVQTLIARDPKAFLAMFDSLKEGMETEEALKKHYHWDYDMLEKAWRDYCKRAH